MSHEAHELELYVDNDADLHRQMTTPIHKNLATKAAKGQYDHDLAVNAFERLAEAGAKKYAKEFGGTWNRLFPPAVRREFAVASARYFEAELGLGNYEHLLPKKYQPKGSAVGAKKTGGGGANMVPSMTYYASGAGGRGGGPARGAAKKRASRR